MKKEKVKFDQKWNPKDCYKTDNWPFQPELWHAVDVDLDSDFARKVLLKDEKNESQIWENDRWRLINECNIRYDSSSV